jgi:lipopolysaccharide heptosyltransferase I
MRFLISRLSALGDTVCTLPVAVALKQTHPDCHITWVVDPRFAGVVECCTAVDEVVRYKPKLGSFPKLAGPFDVALDMQGLVKSAIPVAVSRAKKKVGYHWQREGSALFSQRVLPDPTSFHIVDQYVDVARALGCQMDKAEFQLTPKPRDIQTIKEKLNNTQDFVVLNAGAGWVSKRWNPEYFATLADALPIPSVLVGGPADRETAQEVQNLAKSKPINLAGQTSITELIALIFLARAHVGGDTGTTHIAAALGIPAIGLYAMTRPQRSCPYGQVDRCLYNSDGLQHIQPEPVISKVQEALTGIL